MRHKKATVNRSYRVADQIQRDVAELIRDLKDPRIGMVTINSVEVTPDYAHAQVFFSLLVGDKDECETGLNEAAGFLRNGLFKRLSIHTVPTLHFHFDKTTERAADLSALIARANATRAREDDDPQASASPTPPPEGVGSPGKAGSTRDDPQASALPTPPLGGVGSPGKGGSTRDD